MAVNEVIYDGETLISLTSDTVTEDDLPEGVTAHDASGNIITGTRRYVRSVNNIIPNNEGNVDVEPIYVGSGEMPEEAILQFSLDDVDEEQALKDELKEYIDTELASAIELEISSEIKDEVEN